MAKKKSSSAVRFCRHVIATPCGDETTILLDQPAENNVHAREEVVGVNNPSTTLSTSVDNEAAADTRRESNMESNESTISPYACSPVAIDFGPGHATYWVPKHLLRSPKWSATDAGGTLCLPGVSAATGHTLVHYLYTGTYQTLEAKGEDAATPAHTKFKQALLTFVLASAYELQDLEKLAKEQIEIYGSHMALVEVLDTVRKDFSKVASSWFHKYLQARAEEQFDLDHTFFTSKAFIESVGKGTLHRFMTCHLLEIFSEKLTRTLQGGESRCLDKGKSDAVPDEVEDAAVKTHHCPYYHGGHQTGMYTASEETSFEFPNISCEEVDDVISLENSVRDETPPTLPEPETVPPPEPEPPGEPKPEPVPETSPVKEEEEAKRKKEEEAKRKKEEEVERKKEEEVERKKEEEVEREKKEEEEDAAAAAATSASADLSWAEPPAANDGWASFMATTSAGKKKKGKKGKTESTPPPPPPLPAEPSTTFDDTNFNNVNLDDGVPKIDMNSGDSGAAKTGSGLRGSLSGWSSRWDAANSADNPWDSSHKKKGSVSFDFDFEAFKGPTDAAPAAADELLEDDGGGLSSTAIKSKKKSKRSALIEELVLDLESVLAPKPERKEEDDLWSFTIGSAAKDKKKKKKKGAVEKEPPSPPSESEAPPEPEPVPEPDPVEEEDTWGFAATAPGKKGKKKVQAKIKKKGKTKGEEDAAEPARQEQEAETERTRLTEEEAERNRIDKDASADAAEAEKEKDDTWGDWGFATTTIGKKKKKKKGVVEEETIPVPEEPKPEPAANPEAVPEPEQEYKPEPESYLEETIPETSSTLCPRRSHHLLEGDGWKSCERCRAMLEKIAVQLVKENKTALLLE